MVHSISLRKAMVIIGLVTNLARVAIIPGDTIIGATDQLSGVADQPTFGDIGEILSAIPTGREALALRDAYQTPVRFELGNGSYLDYVSGTIVIDSGVTAVRAALIFVHEMVHNKQFHNGLVPNIYTSSKEEYVDARLKEEAKAEARSVLARIELAEAGIDVSRAPVHFEERFLTARLTSIRSAKRRNPGLSEDQLAIVGREAGEESIFRAFIRGVARRSIDNQTYVSFESNAYDAAHGQSGQPVS